MSLFTVKEFWSYNTHTGAAIYTCDSVAIANVDNDPDSAEKIITGNFSGLLQILKPSLMNGDESEAILAELQLPFPILQVEAGRFVSGTDDVHLAVLHPNQVGVYSVSKLPGQVEHGSQYKVSLLYEHKLKRTAFNMCCGPFGKGYMGAGNREKHFICVQSLDGTLSFFEHEAFTFSRYLPGFLLPGPIAYVPPWDSFITVSSSWCLQCFKYSALAMSKDETNIQSQDTSIGKRLNPEWQFSIGEEPVGGLQVLCTPNSPIVRVVVCTFRHLYCFCNDGELLWCKRLNYQTECVCSYLSDSGDVMTLSTSGNESGTIYIYNSIALKWAAKLPFLPVFISRFQLHVSFRGPWHIPGGLIIMSKEGRIFVGYLGTEPSLFIAPPIQAREIDYEAAELELNRLRKTIAESAEQNVSASKDASVEVKVEFEGQKTKWIEANGMEVMCLIATVKILCHTRVNDVRVNIWTPKPIVCSPESTLIGDIVGRHHYQVEFYAENDAIPGDLRCEVYVFFLNESGVPHFVQKSGIKIPLFIVAKSFETLEREASCKLTFGLNKPVVNLANFYNDFDWGPEASTTGVTFRLFSGDKVTLLASTKTNSSATSRYRVQSSSIAALHIVFKDFLDRIHRKFSREKADIEVSIVAENEIPLLFDFLNEIDTHMQLRQRDIQIKEDLAGRAAQLRAIQRRLLVRFRDKTPVPLTQLEILLDGSVDHINDTLNFLEENQLELQRSESRVSGATLLILELLRIIGGRSNEDLMAVMNALCPNVTNLADEKGWEECVFIALTYLKSQVVVNQDFAQLDATKLKKAIKSTLEKMRKPTQQLMTIPEAPAVFETDSEKLVGNEIIERIASARARTAKKRVSALAPIPEPAEESSAEVTAKAVSEPADADEREHCSLLVPAASEERRDEEQFPSRSGTFDSQSPTNEDPEDDDDDDKFW